MPGGSKSVGELYGPFVDLLDELLAVERHGEGAPHLGIVEWRLRSIQDDEVAGQLVVLTQFRAQHQVSPNHIERAKADVQAVPGIGKVHVQPTGAWQHYHRRDQVFQLHRRVVVVESLEDDHLIGVPPEQLVGTGAVDFLALPPLGTQRLHLAPVDDRGGRIGQLCQEVLLRAVNSDADGAPVENLDSRRPRWLRRPASHAHRQCRPGRVVRWHCAAPAR